MNPGTAVGDKVRTCTSHGATAAVSIPTLNTIYVNIT